MRIVSWNCCWQKDGFTDEKRKEILKLNPDILLVQECKQDDWSKLGFSDNNGHWYGDGKESQGNPNKNLGIGIYCGNNFSIDCSLFKDKDLTNMRYALPYIINYENKEILTIFSVWAKKDFKYFHVPILNSLEYFYKNTNSFVAVIGDFNTGSQYNKETSQYYKFIKNELKTKYQLVNCAFWQEWLPTYHVEKNNNYEFYLDDHCFFERSDEVLSFGMGDWRYWRKYSDHVPLIVDLEDNFYRFKNPKDPNTFLEDRSNKMVKLTRKIGSQLDNTMKEIEKIIIQEAGISKLKYGDYIKEI